MREAKVIVSTRRRKSVLVDGALTGKDSLVAVHVIRGTKLSIDGARRAAGDAVAAAGPGPPHRVADRDVDCVRHKHEAALSHCYIEDLTATRWHAAHSCPSILIHNVNGGGRGMLLLRCGDASVARFSLRRKYQCKRRCQPKSHRDYCIKWFHGLTPFFCAPAFADFLSSSTRTRSWCSTIRHQPRYCVGTSKNGKQNLLSEKRL